MNLRIKPNDETGFWEIHDECGFLCKPESQTTAVLMVHAVNVQSALADFLQAANEAVENCEESLGGLIELRGWLEERLPRLLERSRNTKPQPEAP